MDRREGRSGIVSERTYRIDGGPREATWREVVAYCGGNDAARVAYQNGYVEDNYEEH